MSEQQTTEEQMNKALDAIYATALNLLLIDDIDELHRGLEVIQSLARYKFDVRNTADRKFGEKKEN